MECGGCDQKSFKRQGAARSGGAVASSFYVRSMWFPSEFSIFEIFEVSLSLQEETP